MTGDEFPHPICRPGQQPTDDTGYRPLDGLLDPVMMRTSASDPLALDRLGELT